MNEKQIEQLLWNFSVEILFIVDDMGMIQKVNHHAAKELGFLEQELVGMDIRTLFQKASQPVNLTEVQEGEVESVIYRRNRTCFPVEGRVARSSDGKLYIIALTSAAEKQVAKQDMEIGREAIEQANKVQHEFMANVTHELRTPVNGILGHVRNLLEEEELKPFYSTLHIIEGCCDNMNKIISNLLDFSKLESGKFQMEEREFCFRKMIQQVVDTNIAAVNEKGLKLSVSVAQDVPEYVIGDELRIMQVLNNLISNAMKFTPAGYIKVEIIQTIRKKREVELFFIVMDSGIGISEEGKQKLFQSFSQVDASITRKYGGTGLGLTITQELVHMMGGDIHAEGERGKGSNFSFTVRLKTDEEEVQEEKIAEIINWNPGKMFSQISSEQDMMYEFGSEINEREIRGTFEKLNLSMDMANWAKAENFAAGIKQLLQGGSKNLQRAAFRLEMAVRKSDYEKAKEAEKKVAELLECEWKDLKKK